MPFSEYFAHVWSDTTAVLTGSAGSGVEGTLDDLLLLARELREPTRLARETLDEAVSVQFPGLVGVLPGFGRQEPNDWGLGFELRDAKSPHWTGSLNSPGTYGHFGSKPGTATFLWIDRERQLVCAALADISFGAWAVAAWPALADAVLSEGTRAATR